MKLARLLPALMLVLVACSGIFPASQPTPLPSAPALTPSVRVTPTRPALTPGAAPTAESLPTPPVGPVTLHVWVPPQFDPASGTPAAELLLERLEAFSAQKAGVRVEARVKALEGPGGMIDSLTTANAAAVQALPDLVALPQGMLETAALKGLLHPYPNQALPLRAEDEYEYAQQLGRLQNSLYGLPFAGDALALVYDPATVPQPPADWTAVLSNTQTLIFAAADPQALFTLALYQAAGGPIRDEQGRAFLTPDQLLPVLLFYAQAVQAGVVADEGTQYSSEEQAWEAFEQNEGGMAITWLSRYLQSAVEERGLGPVPTADGKAFTLATGWVWALGSPLPTRQQLSAELAVFLTDPVFLAKWTEAAGYLPPSSAALRSWADEELKAQVEPIAASARLAPSADVLTNLGSALESATVQVLKGQASAQAAAQAAAASLNP